MDNYRKEMYDKIINGVELTERELSELTDISFTDIEGDEHRWTREIMSVVELEGVNFAIDWQRGLTESQEHQFYDQPYVVDKFVETVEVVKWIAR